MNLTDLFNVLLARLMEAYRAQLISSGDYDREYKHLIEQRNRFTRWGSAIAFNKDQEKTYQEINSSKVDVSSLMNSMGK